jgi:hypothetical protein
MGEITASRIVSIADSNAVPQDQSDQPSRAKNVAEKSKSSGVAPIGEPEEQHTLDETA